MSGVTRSLTSAVITAASATPITTPTAMSTRLPRSKNPIGVAAKLFDEHELPVVAVPKTIDNDLAGTDYTFGFDTAVTIATEAIDRLHTTAESHNRVMVVEVMGRHAGWIAVQSGIAGGADVILIPEQPVDFDEVAEGIRKRHARGKNFSIVAVSEGYELTYA